MKAGRKKQVLTEKESVIMNMLWDNGPMFIREMLELYPEPRPHFNTVSTFVRILEGKGYISHEVVGNSHRFYATVGKEDLRERSIADVIRIISTIHTKPQSLHLLKTKNCRSMI